MKWIKMMVISLAIVVTQFASATTVKELTGKELFRAYFKASQMFNYVPTEDEEEMFELKELPKVGINTKDGDFLAVYRGVYEYQNQNNQTRYLVMIEQIPIEEDEEQGQYLSSDCHACTTNLLLMLFQPTANHQYQLLTSHQYEAIGSHGRAALFSQVDWSDIYAVRLGKNTMGLLYEFGYTGQGVTETYLRALLLNDQRISDIRVGDTGSSNEGMTEEDSPLSYSYEATWEIDASKPNEEYYPILIHYQGDNIEYDERGESKFVDMNFTQVFKYYGGDGYKAMYKYRSQQ